MDAKDVQKIIDAAKENLVKELKLAAEMKLDDGTLVTTNGIDFAEGVEIYGVDAEGNNIPLESKEEAYILGGQEFWIVDNKITFTKPEMTPTEVATDVTASEVALETEILNVVESEQSSVVEEAKEQNFSNEDLIKEIETLKTQMIEMANMINDNVKLTTELSKNASKKPAVAPIETKAINLSANNVDDLVARLEENIKKEKI
jgi:hypothetical protein